MIDDPFWSWALIVMFFITMSVYVYIIVFSKSSKRMQKRLSEFNNKNTDNQIEGHENLPSLHSTVRED